MPSRPCLPASIHTSRGTMPSVSHCLWCGTHSRSRKVRQASRKASCSGSYGSRVLGLLSRGGPGGRRGGGGGGGGASGDERGLAPDGPARAGDDTGVGEEGRDLLGHPEAVLTVVRVVPGHGRRMLRVEAHRGVDRRI